jgi:hypothetical protein
MKKLLLAVFALFLTACSNPVGPTDMASVAELPSWMLPVARAADGTYGVYYGAGFGSDPEVAMHMDQILAAASDLTGGSVRFIRSMDSDASLSISIDASSPYAVDHSGWSTIQVSGEGYLRRSVIGVRSRYDAMTNVALHELGHFLFGPGHSSDPDDIMNPSRASYSRLSFSVNEYAYWRTAKQYPIGTRQ